MTHHTDPIDNEQSKKLDAYGWRAWVNITELAPKQFRCGYCGESISSDRGYQTQNINPPALIYACHHCGRPTLFDRDDSQNPGPLYGGDVADITDVSVEQLYNEARRCTAVYAYTASVLASRKLLMHIAVAKGAKPGESFISYVEFLSDNHYVPPGAKLWVDHIRKKGNEANHEIVIMKEEDAKDLLSFLEMLLKMIYEFPANITRRTTKPEPAS